MWLSIAVDEGIGSLFGRYVVLPGSDLIAKAASVIIEKFCIVQDARNQPFQPIAQVKLCPKPSRYGLLKEKQ